MEAEKTPLFFLNNIDDHKVSSVSLHGALRTTAISIVLGVNIMCIILYAKLIIDTDIFQTLQEDLKI